MKPKMEYKPYFARRLTDRIPAGKRCLEPDIFTNPGISVPCLMLGDSDLTQLGEASSAVGSRWLPWMHGHGTIMSKMLHVPKDATVML